MTKNKKTSIAFEENPDWLLEAPSGAALPPPVETRIATLPFGEIHWPDFERLCRALAKRRGNVEHVLAYGTVGQRQYGIDILVRLEDGSYEVWQSKRYRQIKPQNIRDAAQIFLKHQWAEKANKFVLAAACDFDSTGVVDAIEEFRDSLKSRGITLEPLDASELSTRMRSEPELVDDFFGRDWAEAFCPPEAGEVLAARIARLDLDQLRKRVRDWFTNWIATVDPGLPLSDLGGTGRLAPALPLTSRFIKPDILIRIDDGGQESPVEIAPPQSSETSPNLDSPSKLQPRAMRSRRSIVREERIQFDRLLKSENRIVVSGEAGMGKTTLLRAIALDCLSDNPEFAALRDLPRHIIPIWVPFALWARMAARKVTPPPLSEVVRAFFESHGEPELAKQLSAAVNADNVVLLVDGLDEATSEVAARTVSTVLATYVSARNITTIVTTRPHALALVGRFPASWRRVELAPLSDHQRKSLATMWFEALAAAEGIEDCEDQRRLGLSRAEALELTLRRNAGIGRLSQTPLFLLALLQLHRQNLELPNSRFAVVDKIAEQLVEHQPHRRATAALDTDSTELHPRQRDRLLADFAYGLHSGELDGPINDTAWEEAAVARAITLLRNRQPGIDEDRAEEMARSVLSFAEERAGILVKRASNALGFMHLSMQEFLTARHLIQLTFEERLQFVSSHCSQLRWRSPILYLLYLEENEAQLGQLMRAIQKASPIGAQATLMRDALLTEAIFADFAHDQTIVRTMANELLDWAEFEGYGPILNQILFSTVDGLFSESLSDICSARLRRWIPSWHGSSRVEVFRSMPSWDPSSHEDCGPILLRALVAEEDWVRFTAAETLPNLNINAEYFQSKIAELIRSPPSTAAVSSALRAFSGIWAKTDLAEALARSARSSPDPTIAMEAIRIRANRSEADHSDFERFFQIRFGQEDIIRFRERKLIEQFAVSHHDVLIERLEAKIRQASGYGREIQSLVGALMICDPDHALVAKHLERLFSEEFNFRNLLTEGFPADQIRWSPELVNQARSFANDEKAHFHDFELYWLAKVLPAPWLKTRLIEILQHEQSNRYWSAKGLVEFWGVDSEVKEAIESIADRGGKAAASVARVLPEIVDDKERCRSLLLGSLVEGGERIDFVVNGFRKLGLSEDREVFEECWRAGSAIRSPAFQQTWRGEMIRTFPDEDAVRKLASEELYHRYGQVGAVADAYSSDEELRCDLLKIIDTLSSVSRSALISRLHGAAFSSSLPLDLLKLGSEDEDAQVAASSKIAWAEVVQSIGAVSDADIEWLRRGLYTIGLEYDQRRAASLICLAIVGRLDVFLSAIEQKDKPLKVNLGRPSYLADDRYLRGMLPYWTDFLQALGGVDATVSRLSLSAETILDLIRPDIPNAEKLYAALMDRVPEEKHVHKNAILAAMARFKPRSGELRQIVREWLVGRASGEYWAGLVAAEVFGEQFSDDSAFVAEVLAAVGKSDFAAAAIAEYCLRIGNAEIEAKLREETSDRQYDIAISFKLMSALSTPAHLITALEEVLSDLPEYFHQLHLPRWIPAVIKRVERDPDLQRALTEIIGSGSPSLQVTSISLLSAAGRLDNRFRIEAEAEIDRQNSKDCPDAGFDLVAEGFRLVKHALEAAIFDG